MKYTKIFIAILLVLSSLLLSSCAALPKDLFFESTTATDKTPTGTTASSGSTDSSGETPAVTGSDKVSTLPQKLDASLCDKYGVASNGKPWYEVTSGAPGYKTIDGVTYFFIKCYVPNYPYCPMWYKCSSYGDYEAIMRYSNNLSSFRLINGVDMGNSAGLLFADFDDALAGYCYISYCAISNCADPDAVLADLVTNVFDNTDYFEIRISTAAG